MLKVEKLKQMLFLDFKLKMKKKLIMKKILSTEVEVEEEVEEQEEAEAGVHNKSLIEMKLRILKEWISVIILIIDISLYFKTERENRRNTKKIENRMIIVIKVKEGIIEVEEV